MNIKYTKYLRVPCPCCGADTRKVNGLYLRELRKAHNISQREFGKINGVSGPYISDIETNRRDCPEDIFVSYEALEK